MRNSDESVDEDCYNTETLRTHRTHAFTKSSVTATLRKYPSLPDYFCLSPASNFNAISGSMLLHFQRILRSKRHCMHKN